MGLRGPLPKPINIRRFEGNRSHRPLPASPQPYVSLLPDKPKGMSPAAKKVWRELIVELAPMNVLRRVDAMALAQLCEDQAALNELRRGSAELGTELARLAVEGKKGLHGGPMIQLSRTIEGRRTATTIRELSLMVMMQRREFGMTPASANRVQNGSTASDDYIDPLEKMMLSFVAGGR